MINKQGEPTIVMVGLNNLVPTYDTEEANPNRMDAEQFDQLVSMIKANGFLQPLLARKSGRGKYTVIDGHHRLRAAREAGVLGELPVVVVAKADDHRALAMGIGMNRARGELDIALAVETLRRVHEATEWTADELSVLSGFTADEITSLVLEADSNVVDLGDVAAGASTEDASEAAPRPYVLEITFSDRDKYKLARRKLRRAAGAGNDLSVGLLSVLGED